jgi:hypothetical protein
MRVATNSAVVLRGGVSVPLSALRLLWDLEARGFSLTQDGEALMVAPRSRLNTEDDAAIRQHRDELLALVRYCEDVQ